MKITVNDIAQIAGGRVVGDGTKLISTFSPIEEAVEGAISFLSNPKYAQFLYETKATAVLVDESFTPEKEVTPALIFVKDVYTVLSNLLDKFNQAGLNKKGIEQPSYITQTSTLGENIYVGAFAYIGEDCKIGNNVKIFPQVYVGDNSKIADNTILFPGVKIYANTEIGENCILHSGCVIGSDGFGFAPQKDGTYKKMPQTGKVIIGNNVEIGANTTIDRATIKATIIGNGVKLDNLIQIAHNVELGENTALASQVGISGSTKVGKNVMMGGQVGVAGHIKIGDGVRIGGQTGVTKSIEGEGTKWFGTPAEDFRTYVHSLSVFKKLPELYTRIQDLEKQIKGNNK
ncbi:MAG: UDP-3-O-(3-hydroxymyristoyl)glucosamine N-acyltransferase [Bacteroidetes bacterium]|nr:UDP-3-O-(3-hydroxymyristoyl)glucosamine N-acyltransferase [Bacteroidota bacterium]